jgi:hypothetical protein
MEHRPRTRIQRPEARGQRLWSRIDNVPLAEFVAPPHTATVTIARHMRWAWLVVIGIAACTSAWERHESSLRAHAANGEWDVATAEARWMIDNSFLQAPAGERTTEADAARQLRLAQLAAKSGDTRTAVQALREALTIDPSQASAIRAQLDALPLSAAEADRIKREFAWNIAALAPSDDALLQQERVDAECWSYRVREVRIRRQRTVRTGIGMERQVTYDARTWVFDAGAHRWSADGEWVNDIGTEIEPVDGPQRPRYRALTDADHEFYVDGTVPPCHRDAWRGPFEADGTVFVAAQLPAS